jgi:hypothetical protein
MLRVFFDKNLRVVVSTWEFNGKQPYTPEQMIQKLNLSNVDYKDFDFSPTGKVISFEVDGNLDLVVNYAPTKPVYNPNDLIVRAMSEFPQFIGTSHEYVLATFANNPKNYKSLMLQRAAILDTNSGGTTFTDIANQLILMAIELGADITE